jgi:hypothetical protein
MITGPTYSFIAYRLGEIDAMGHESASFVDASVQPFQDMDVPAGKDRDVENLVNTLTSTADQLVAAHQTFSLRLRALVVLLQQMVGDYAGSVDAFLQNEDVTVTADFAALSAVCGYPISVSLVEPESSSSSATSLSSESSSSDDGAGHSSSSSSSS